MADWVIRLIDSTGYFGVFLLMLTETVSALLVYYAYRQVIRSRRRS